MADALDAKFIDTIVKINASERNPMKTSTFGFGQMIKDAISKGAAYVYAPQKGANGRMVKQLDDGLKHFAGLVKERWRANLLCSPNLYQTSRSFLSLQAVLV